MGNRTYNGVVHGARIGPRSVIRGELMDSLVPTVVESTACGGRAFGVSSRLPSSARAGQVVRRAVWKA